MNIKEQWIQLAGELGFQFKEGIDALIDSPHLEKIVQEELQGKIRDLQQVRNLLKSTFVKTMLSKIFMGIATGTYREFEFLIYRGMTSSSGSGTRNYHVNIVLFFKTPYHWGMEITPAGFFSKWGKLFFPKAYVKLPYSRLDPLVVIKGKEKEHIKTLLSYEKLQQGLIQLFSYPGDFKVSDYGIRFKEPGEILPKEHTIDLMNIMVKTAESFY